MDTHNQTTVLVVDDEQAIRRVTADVLQREGYGVLQAADGREALDLYRDHPTGRIGCIVLDLTLPRMSGEQVLRAIRAQGDALPVVVTSGYGADEILATVADLANVRVLSKPFTPRQLAEVVRDSLAPPPPQG